MKLTKEDIALFKTLSKSDMGKQLMNYLDRMSDSICDSRNWKKDDTRESTVKASEYIKTFLRDKISIQTTKEKSSFVNDYE